MTKIIVTEAQLKQHINELFSQKLVDQLVDRFRQEQPDLSDQVINFYIERFQQIKESPKVVNKDITTYSWIELRSLVDNNQPQKVDVDIDNSTIIYDENNLKIYLANSQKACVKYGTGYNFCISSRGEDNQYSQYRLNTKKTIYFVLDEDRSKARQLHEQEGMDFDDPAHLLIIMVKNHYFTFEGKRHSKIKYEVTNANNDGTKGVVEWKDVARINPKLKNLGDLFVPVEPNQNEKMEFDLRQQCNDKLQDLMHKHKVVATDYNIPLSIKLTDYAENHLEYRVFFEPDKKDIPYIDMIVNAFKNNKPIYNYIGATRQGVRSNRSEVTTETWDKDEWERKVNKGRALFNQLKLVKIDVINYQESYITYLEKVKETILNYFHEKNKLNIPMVNENRIKLATRSALNELFSQKLVLQLVAKFREEDNTIPPETLDFYINRFQQIKDSPKVVNKDITTYSWNDLETVIIDNQPKPTTKNVNRQEDTVYNNNGLEILLGNTEDSCIMYGDGYKFCISARSEGNAFDTYREDNTTYFVIDHERSKEKDEGGDYIDPYHIIVVMIDSMFEFDGFTATDANNKVITISHHPDGERDREIVESFEDLTYIQPKLKGKEHLFKAVEAEPKFTLKHRYQIELEELANKYPISFPPFTSGDDKLRVKERQLTHFMEISKNSWELANTIFDKGMRYTLYDKMGIPRYGEIKVDNEPKNEWFEKVKKKVPQTAVGAHATVTEFKNYPPEYKNYVEKVKELMREYYRKLSTIT